MSNTRGGHKYVNILVKVVRGGGLLLFSLSCRPIAMTCKIIPSVLAKALQSRVGCIELDV